MEEAASGAVTTTGEEEGERQEGDITGPIAIWAGLMYKNRKELMTKAATELAVTGRFIINGSSAGKNSFHVKDKICVGWFIKGCRQGHGDFRVTQAKKGPVNCVGGGRRPSARMLQPMVEEVGRGNPKISGPAIIKSLKIRGFDVIERSAQRAKRKIVEASADEEVES